MHTKEIEEYKKSLKLTRYQRELIVGKLLGDGHLETSDRGRTYRLKIEHSIRQKSYVDWLYAQMKEWVRAAPKPRRVKSGFSYRDGRGTMLYGFQTYSHGALRFYGQQFYGGGRKRIPPLIKKLLTPIAVALWYLDDGSWKSNRHTTYIIHTHGYARKDLQQVQNVFDQLKIQARLHRQIRSGRTYWQFYIMSKSAERFRKLLEPTVMHIPGMGYKLGNTMPKE